MIYKYAKGTFSSPSLYAAGFSGTQSFRFNAAGEMFVPDRAAGKVYQVTPGGTTASSHTVWASGLTLPFSIAIDPITQDVFVGDAAGNVTRITAPGVFSTFATGLTAAEGIGFDTAGNLYVADKFAGAIWKFTRIVGTTIFPTRGGNTGSVTAQITGTGLQAGATVKLTGLGPDIIGADSTLLAPSVLSTTFDLTGAAPGARTVVVTNPDDTSLTLPDGFTVEQGGEAKLSVEIIGLDKIRIGDQQTYYLSVTNSGSVDGIVGFETGPTSSGAGLARANILGAPLACSFITPTADIIGAFSTVFYPGICQTSSSGCGQTFTYKAQDFSTLPDCSNQKQTVRFLKARIAAAQASLAAAESRKASLEADYRKNNCATNPNTPVCIAIQAQLDAVDIQIQNLQNLIASLTDQLKKALKDLHNCLKGQQSSSADLFGSAVSSLSSSISTISASISLCGVNSLDPNDKVGAQGFGSQHFVGPEPLRYSIFFNNKPTATAPAQDIVVTDQLNIGQVGSATVTLGPILFNGNIVSPPGVPLAAIGGFTTDVDLRPTQDLIARISGSIAPNTGLLTWHLQSIDPATGLPTTDPTAGLLPPGKDGSVSFTVLPQATATTGTVVLNKATVIFDGSPLTTPAWMNTLDNTSPTSRVLELAPNQSTSCFRPQWSGSDLGSGLASFSILASDNGGPYTSWLTGTTASSAIFGGQAGHSYAFYSQATDLVGNVEPAKTSPDATTIVTPGATCDGRPSIVASISSNTLAGTTETLGLQVTNNGVGNAPSASLNQITFRTLAGTGLVTLASPAVPVSLGSLPAGASTIITLKLNAPSTVKEFSMTETGNLLDLAGNQYSFSIGQAVFP